MHKLFVFNPGHEEALKVSLKQNYTPSKEVRKLRQDLASLMCYFAGEGDYVLQWGEGSNPDKLLNHKGEVVKDTAGLPELRLQLWALEGHCLKEVEQRAKTLSLKLIYPTVSEEYLRLSHRSTSVLMLEHLSKHWQDCSSLIPYWFYPKADWEAMQEELETYLKAKEKQGIKNLLVKRAYTSSGRGLSPLSLPCNQQQQEALLLQIRRWGGLSLEEKLDLVTDWAIEYHIDKNGMVEFIALSKFNTNSFGAYQANILEPQSKLYAELYKLLGKDLPKLIDCQKAFLKEHLAKSYEGYIGVDILVYKSKEGELKLHPCIEINIRSTMGLVAHLVYEQEQEGFKDKPEKPITFHVDYLRSSWDDLQTSLNGSAKLLTKLKENTSFAAFLLQED